MRQPNFQAKGLARAYDWKRLDHESTLQRESSTEVPVGVVATCKGRQLTLATPGLRSAAGCQMQLSITVNVLFTKYVKKWCTRMRLGHCPASHVDSGNQYAPR